MPSRRHSSATLYSPRKPSSTMRIFSSAERCLLVADVFNNLIRRCLRGIGLLSHLLFSMSYDEPEILRSSTRQFCPTRADGGHASAMRYWNAALRATNAVEVQGIAAGSPGIAETGG